MRSLNDLGDENTVNQSEYIHQARPSVSLQASFVLMGVDILGREVFGSVLASKYQS